MYHEEACGKLLGCRFHLVANEKGARSLRSQGTHLPLILHLASLKRGILAFSVKGVTYSVLWCVTLCSNVNSRWCFWDLLAILAHGFCFERVLCFNISFDNFEKLPFRLLVYWSADLLINAYKQMAAD